MTSAEQDDTFPKCQHLPILTIIIFGISFFFFFKSYSEANITYTVLGQLSQFCVLRWGYLWEYRTMYLG